MERQHGPVHYDQLREDGLSHGQIKYRLATKQIRRVHPEVYVAQYRKLTLLGSWSAAVLAGGDEAFLACRSAGQFHGIFEGYEGEVEILVARADAPQIKGIHARKATFGPGETTTRKNIRVTTLERTLLDLAGVLTFDELSAAFQKAMRLGLWMKRLEQIIARHRKAKGRRNLRKLIARHQNDKGTGRGDFENVVYPWLIGWLPKRLVIQRNVRFKFDDGITREADFLISDRVWIEVDHHGHHAGAGAKKATEDHQRDRAIRRAGFQLGRYTDYEFTHDKAAIRDDIEYLLQRAGV